MSWMAACGLARQVTHDLCLQLAHGSQTKRELNPHKKEVSGNGLTGKSRACENPRQAVGEQDAAFRAAPAIALSPHFYRYLPAREKLSATGCVQVHKIVRGMRYQKAASTLLRVQRLLSLASAFRPRRHTRMMAQFLPRHGQSLLAHRESIGGDDARVARAILNVSYTSGR